MKMTAALLFEQGLPHPFTVSKPLRIEQIDLQAPGPGEVLIEVAAAGLCHSDLSTIEGVRHASCRPWSATKAQASFARSVPA
jgi:alcohol dehydrogenase